MNDRAWRVTTESGSVYEIEQRFNAGRPATLRFRRMACGGRPHMMFMGTGVWWTRRWSERLAWEPTIGVGLCLDAVEDGWPRERTDGWGEGPKSFESSRVQSIEPISISDLEPDGSP